MDQRCNILLSKTITRYALINWAESKEVVFNEDYSIKAIQYHLYDFKNDLISFFNESIDFSVDSLYIKEINEIDIEIIFEIEKCYTSFHKPEKKEILLIPITDGNLYSLDYTGFKIDFKH